MNDYIRPLLKKKPTTIILHVGTNNAQTDMSHQIVQGILDLKATVLKELPEAKVLISMPTFRIDHAKASLTTRKVYEKLVSEKKIDVVDNSNIDISHL